MGVSLNHPFWFGIFHDKQSSYWVPLWPWKALDGMISHWMGTTDHQGKTSYDSWRIWPHPRVPQCLKVLWPSYWIRALNKFLYSAFFYNSQAVFAHQHSSSPHWKIKAWHTVSSLLWLVQLCLLFVSVLLVCIDTFSTPLPSKNQLFCLLLSFEFYISG